MLELIIIEELMERIKWNEKLERTTIPAHCFNLIGGTSMGGESTLTCSNHLIHYHPVTKPSVLSQYSLEDYDYWLPRLLLPMRILLGMSSERKTKRKDGTFKASRLEEAIKSVVISHLGQNRSDALMYEEGIANGCRTLVVSIVSFALLSTSSLH